jgi:hypothetical protein
LVPQQKKLAFMSTIGEQVTPVLQQA